MTPNEKTDLKAMTTSIRAKLTDNSSVLQNIIDNPGNLAEQLGERITECNNLIEYVNTVDEYIDAHTETASVSEPQRSSSASVKPKR